MPEALKNRPELNNWVMPCWNAFQLLTASRPLGMGGVGPIPLTEIEAYCRMYQVDDLDEREQLVTMIRALDSVYLVKQAAIRAAEQKKNGRRN